MKSVLGWVHALPRIHLNLMNTIDKSMGYMPFQLHIGQSPIVIPLLVPTKSSATVTDIDVWHII